MNRFTHWRTKIAGRIVTYYYNRAYEKAVRKADERHLKENTTIYVIDHFRRGEILSTINRKEFRDIKHAAQKLHRNSMFWSEKYGTPMLREQCWYHTPDGSGKNGLTALQKEARRIALIRQGLKRARV